MRILLLNDESVPSSRGGAAVIVDQLRREYARRGHTVTLVTTHQDPHLKPVERHTDLVGTVVSVFRSYPPRQRHRKCLYDAAMSRALASVFGHFTPEVVHAHNLHAYLTYDALRVARAAGARTFLTAHDTFLVSFDRVRGPRFEAAAFAGQPLVMRWKDHIAAVGRKFWPPRNTAIRSVLAATGTTVVGISEATAAFLRANGIPCSVVIPNGIAPQKPATPDEVATFRRLMHLEGPVILFAGRIREDKGVGVLLRHFDRILAELPSARLLIAGERAQLLPHLDAVSLAVRRAVITTDWLPRDKMRLAYAAADVVATPSLYLDNFPTVNLEAMAAAKPVVGTCFGGTPEAVVDGRTGFICNPHDDSFGDALLRLLRDPPLRHSMGEAARLRVEEMFSLQTQANRYLRLFGV